MFFSDLVKIIFSFCFGFLLSPFSSGILLLPLSMFFFLIIDCLFEGSHFNYSYFEHRGSMIYYSLIGFLLGRYMHGMCSTPIILFHQKNQTKKLKRIPAVIIGLYNNIHFIKNIKKDQKVNLADKRIISVKDFSYYLYRNIYNNSPKEIVEFIEKIYQETIECLNFHKDNITTYNKIYYTIKKCTKGITNLSNTYPTIKNELLSINERIKLI